MKMVKVNGKMVPFYAADGRGSSDLRKAMYGMKMGATENKPPQTEMGGGGKMYKYMKGGEFYKVMEDGGEMDRGPIKGMSNLRGRFRVVPEPERMDVKDSPIQYKFYVDGEERNSEDFVSMLREADPNIDVNEMVKNSTEDAGLRWDNQSSQWSYTGNTPGYHRNIKGGMEERSAFASGGKEGVDELYESREKNLAARLRAGRLNYMDTSD